MATGTNPLAIATETGGESAAAASCWCGGGGPETVFRTKRFGLVRCEECGCYRIDPPPIQDDESSPEFYTEYYCRIAGDQRAAPELLDAPGRTSRFWRVHEREAPLVPLRGRALDIGCGEGTLCAELLAAGCDSVAGVDVSRARILRARRRYPEIEFFDRNLPSLPFSAGSFDLVVMDNVIEHLPRPAEFLGHVRRLLAPGGRFVVLTPNMRSGHFRLLGRRWTPELAPHAHIYLFTHPSMDRILREAGFAPLAHGDFHLPLPPPNAWAGMLRRLEAKHLVWSLVQESGSLFGRLISSGPMLYAVASPE